jgi:hypothetical protein
MINGQYTHQATNQAAAVPTGTPVTDDGRPIPLAVTRMLKPTNANNPPVKRGSSRSHRPAIALPIAPRRRATATGHAKR